MSRLTRDFHSWMNMPAGREPLAYLRRVAFTVLPQTAGANEFVYREGARWFLALMEAMAAKGTPR